MTHNCDLSARYTKEVAEKGSIAPLQELQETGKTGWCHRGAFFADVASSTLGFF